MAERAVDMDELEVAEAMAKGDLPSPQRYGSFWLFDIRITGTGLSYRVGRKEFVWRDKALYLNDRFLKRANGLPVLFDHPKEKPTLDSDEFNARIVGTTFIPYIKGEDVWAIVKIYDTPTAELLLDKEIQSTSPAVVFKAATSTNETVELDNGETLLIEGKPALLDHIALCEAGVWDKGGPPTGVAGADTMADEEKEKASAEKDRQDAEAKRDAMMDSIMDAFKRMDSRLDSFEKERKDAAHKDAARKDKFGKRRDGESYKDWGKRHDDDMRNMADALRKFDAEKSEEDCMDAAKDARKDAEEDEKRNDKDFDKWAKEEEKEPEHKEDSAAKDAAAKDAEEKERTDAEEKEAKEKEEEKQDAKKDAAVNAENAELRLRLKSLEDLMKGVKRESSREDADALAASQARADGVSAMFGDRAPPPIPGETPLDYRRRMAKKFQRHSARFKDTRLESLDAATLDTVEDIIYHDAIQNAREPGDVTPGILVPSISRDEAGRQITRFHGDVMGFLGPFMPQEAQIAKIANPQNWRR